MPIFQMFIVKCPFFKCSLSRVRCPCQKDSSTVSQKSQWPVCSSKWPAFCVTGSYLPDPLLPLLTCFSSTGNLPRPVQAFHKPQLHPASRAAWQAAEELHTEHWYLRASGWHSQCHPVPWCAVLVLILYCSSSEVRFWLATLHGSYCPFAGSFATATCMQCKRQVDCEVVREDIMNQVGFCHCPIWTASYMKHARPTLSPFLGGPWGFERLQTSAYWKHLLSNLSSLLSLDITLWIFDIPSLVGVAPLYGVFWWRCTRCYEAWHCLLWRESSWGVPQTDGAGQRPVRPADCNRVLTKSPTCGTHTA